MISVQIGKLLIHSCHRPPHTLSSRGRSPWQSTVNQKGKREVVCVLRETMDCRVGHLCSLLAMTKWELHNFSLHGKNTNTCHREGESPWRSTVNQQPKRLIPTIHSCYRDLSRCYGLADLNLGFINRNRKLGYFVP